jgi:catechol 2,3-dioxygenase-like lactoylglutathione lyase family enzyme
MVGTTPAPRLDGVLETAIYVDDLDRSGRFYADVMGLRAIFANDRLVAFDIAGGQVLLVFRRGGSAADSPGPRGVIPGHDGAGPLHLAFKVTAEILDSWRRRLSEHGIAVESEVTWPAGGVSLYFRDPDRHLIELATPGLWSIY